MSFSHKKGQTALKSVGEQIQTSPIFQNLMSELAAHHQLQILFDRECPLELAGRCQVLGIKEECLFMQTENAAFSTQLRYRSRELLIALNKYVEFQGIKKLHVHVNRCPVNNSKSVPKATPISREAAKSLAESAIEIQDKELRAALLKLSSIKDVNRVD